jgi:hypothetical protein
MRPFLILVVLVGLAAGAIFLFVPGPWSPKEDVARVDRLEREEDFRRPEPDGAHPDSSAELPETAPRKTVTPPPPPRVIRDQGAFVVEWAERIPLAVPTEWLSIKSPFDRVVAATNAVALGENPMAQLPFLRPTGRFEPGVTETGELVLPPELDTRYRKFLLLLESVDPTLAAEAFGQAEPYLDRAYQNLGYPDGRFRPVLIESITILLATPHPEQPVELVGDSVTFEYADENLELLDPAQRLLLRLSPTARQRVDRKLAALQESLSSLPN